MLEMEMVSQARNQEFIRVGKVSWNKGTSMENKPMEGFYVEINLRKSKWLLCCSFNPSKSSIDFHLEHFNRNLALYSSCYENLMVIGDFNVEANNSAMSVFSDTYNLKTLIK